MRNDRNGIFFSNTTAVFFQICNTNFFLALNKYEQIYQLLLFLHAGIGFINATCNVSKPRYRILGGNYLRITGNYYKFKDI